MTYDKQEFVEYTTNSCSYFSLIAKYSSEIGKKEDMEAKTNLAASENQTQTFLEYFCSRKT